MSKNFELMQQAGKLLEIEIPVVVEPRGIAGGAVAAPAFDPTSAPRAFTPTFAPRRGTKWLTGRGNKYWTADQITREEAQRLVQHVFMVQSQEPPRVVVFAGIDHGNGCSRICSHTAEAIKENLRGSICLVEANFRSPSLRHLRGKSNHHGLADALLSDGPMRSFANLVGSDNCYLMPCGSVKADSHRLLNSNRLTSRFRDLRNEFDFVVVDAPPLTRYSDAIALAKVSDGIVLVLEANATRREAAIQISQHLRASQIRILAAVLNKRTFPIPETLYRRL